MNPAERSFLLGKATELKNSGHPRSALQIIELLSSSGKDDREVRCLELQCLLSCGEYTTLLKNISLMKDSYTDCDVLLIAAKASFELGYLTQCATFADKVLAFNPENIDGLCYKAKCCELAGNLDDAVNLYKTVLRSDPFCVEALDFILERHLLPDKQELSRFLEDLNVDARSPTFANLLRARAGQHVDDTSGLPRKVALFRLAEDAYRNADLRTALRHTNEVTKLDSCHRQALCLRLAVLIEMKATPKLFEEAHALCTVKSQTDLAVYAIGCYYYSLSNYERAGRYFNRATEINPFFAEACIAYGHCYAKLEEGEQALTVYRKACNYFPGLHACKVFAGMQYSRVHQWPLALSFYEDALNFEPHDPLTLNEIGVLHFRNQRLPEAFFFFQKSLDCLPSMDNPPEHLDCVIFNAATACRKLKRYDDALRYYNIYVKNRPNAGHGHCALGFTHHLAGDLRTAIYHYHLALSIKPDSFCRDMLERALSTDAGQQVFLAGTTAPASGLNDNVSFASVIKTVNSKVSTTTINTSDTSPGYGVGRSLLF